jgi:opacity protein-like surface antigen
MLSVSADAKDWSYQLEPYVLASSIEGDASIGRATGVNVDVDMSDILEVLDIGAMVHFEAHNNNGWGVALDYGFMNLSADISGPRGGVVGAKVHQGVFEALLVRQSGSGNGHLEYLAGVRWWDNDIDVEVDPAALPGTPTFNVKEDWVDLVLGVRWSNPINDRWTLKLRGDIGGLGLESDFTSAVSAGLHFNMTKSMDLDLQYKATWVDFETGSRGQPGYFQYDTVTHGPIIGVIFNF